MQELSKQELRRYSRHLALPGVGLAGQQQLKNSSALIVGCGGLGSPAAMYLAAAGVGKIGLVDFDKISLDNLQRQILYQTNETGASKVLQAQERLHALNPEIEIAALNCELGPENAERLLANYDVILDCTDNFNARYLINSSCVKLKKPYVFASIYQFEGQLAVFNFSGGPCYQCLYPASNSLFQQSCAEGGVLGILPGVLGSMQALEAIKIIIGLGEVASGRLVLFNALALTMRSIAIEKNPDCLCSKSDASAENGQQESGKPEELLTQEQAQMQQEEGGESLARTAAETKYREDISGRELKALMDDPEAIYDLIDVREQYEAEISFIEGAKLIPLSQFIERMQELKPENRIIVYCKVGQRSQQVVHYLRQQGFKHAQNLTGGINAWAREIDLNLAEY